MAYSVHVLNHIGKHTAATAAPPAPGIGHRGISQPSYSPDTPFSFFSDAYSEYGDEQCISSLDALTDSATLHDLVHSGGDTGCETVLNLWDRSW